MNEYVIWEDRKRLCMYTLLNLILTALLVIVASSLYSFGSFLFAFLAITGLWFSVKAMCRYGSKWMKKTPVCEFTNDEVILHSLPGSPKVMKYKEISEVKILRNATSVKLFFGGDNVEHPSGWYYAGALYPFQRTLLNDVEQSSQLCLEKHKVKVRKVER